MEVTNIIKTRKLAYRAYREIPYFTANKIKTIQEEKLLDGGVLHGWENLRNGTEPLPP